MPRRASQGQGLMAQQVLRSKGSERSREKGYIKTKSWYIQTLRCSTTGSHDGIKRTIYMTIRASAFHREK